jgi:hypothetical protein
VDVRLEYVLTGVLHFQIRGNYNGVNEYWTVIFRFKLKIKLINISGFAHLNYDGTQQCEIQAVARRMKPLFSFATNFREGEERPVLPFYLRLFRST